MHAPPIFSKNAKRVVRVILLAFLVLLALATLHPLRAAATLTQQIDPPEASVGDQVAVTFTVQNGTDASIEFPHVDGLEVEGSSSATQISFDNGRLTSAASQTFTLIPQRAGDFTIPGFDIHTRDGDVLRARPMKLHVLAGTTPAQGTPFTPQGNGPVVQPPATANAGNPLAPGNPANPTQPEIQAPVDSDGRPARVFMVITAKTTDAYVGEAIPLRIEFYIRLDSDYQQDSLPTIEGSDFLMNDITDRRPAEDEMMVMNEAYRRETWVTAISAPRSGDFPLEMVRDTYWTKTSQDIFANPLGNFFGGRPNLAHGSVMSNKLVIHSRPLPLEGRPHDFTGAIGQFTATGKASPATINVGDPAYLDFSVSGDGNFDSVRCPTLVPDPAWKSYVSSSQVHYVDEAHTEGEKTFHQAIIARKNGQLPLPAATFSYFDPTANKYTTIPIALPTLTVTGAPLAPTPAAPAAADATSVAAAPAAAEAFTPNRLELGMLRPSLMPAYRQPWFWLSQAGVLLLALLVALAASLRARYGKDRSRAEYVLRRRSLQELETAMSAAVRSGDAPAFFVAAKRAVQLRWSAALGRPPEAVTLPALAAHDPQLAEAAAPLFEQADEVMYSGRAPDGIDLAEWERRVHEELLQAQPT